VTARAVVLDVEGTIGALSHVRDVLLPYFQRRLARWCREHRGGPAYTEGLEAVRAFAGRPGLDEDQVVGMLLAWAAEDRKVAPLKLVQGVVWADGYARGELWGHVYPDVPEVLSRWHAAGISCFIYSSGSVAAQRDWFRHNNHGDLSGLLQDYFDLTNAGPKSEPRSYSVIGASIGAKPQEILFLSDAQAELDAARSVGWRTAAVRRPDDPRDTCVPGHPTFPDLYQVSDDFEIVRPPWRAARRAGSGHRQDGQRS
jgi:enolase-phosphatase E1